PVAETANPQRTSAVNSIFLKTNPKKPDANRRKMRAQKGPALRLHSFSLKSPCRFQVRRRDDDNGRNEVRIRRVVLAVLSRGARPPTTPLLRVPVATARSAFR